MAIEGGAFRQAQPGDRGVLNAILQYAAAFNMANAAYWFAARIISRMGWRKQGFGCARKNNYLIYAGAVLAGKMGKPLRRFYSFRLPEA